MFIRGKVKNVSNKSLSNVQVVGKFETASGEFEKTSNALIDYDPLLPGQTSPFSTFTTHNPAFKHCAFHFKELLCRSIAFATRKDRIERIQTLLNSAGYDAGKPDGIMGPMTRAAIRKFQKDNAMKVDGEASHEVLARLREK